MKRNLFTKTIVLSVALSALLAGCGSTTASDAGANQTTSISGKAVDGYLQYATVCLDMDKDGYCQESEPKTQTLEDGSFTLEISSEVKAQEGFDEAMLLVYGGKDTDTGADFRGKLLAPADASVINISPITTLLAKAVQKEIKKENRKLSKDEIAEKITRSKEKLAATLGLTIADLVKDPVAEKSANPELIKQALKLQKSIESIEIDGDNDNIEKMYEKFADELENADSFEQMYKKAIQEDAEKLKIIEAINENIDTSFDHFDGDLEKIAFITKDDMKKLKEGHEVFKRDKDTDTLFNKTDDEWDTEFLKDGLAAIGIDNPTQEQIDQLKEIAGGDKIKPGFIYEKEEELKNDNKFSDINEAIEEIKIQKEHKKEAEDARHSKDIKIDLKTVFGGKTLYLVDNYYDDVTNTFVVDTISLEFNADVTAVIDDENITTKLTVDGNSIYAYGDDEKDILTFKSQKKDFYEFYSNDGEIVRFFADSTLADVFAKEQQKKFDEHKEKFFTLPEGER